MSRSSKPTHDRNGIPIIDVPPEQENKLPKRCRPGVHQFRQVGEPKFIEFDPCDDVTYKRTEYRCIVCGVRDFQDISEVGGSWR